MADFNLSAAISLQLAQGAVAGLKKQIQDGFKAPLVLTDVDKAEKEIKKAKKKAEDPIVVPISFAKKEIKEQKDKLTKSIGAVEVDVVFSPASVRSNLSNKALKALIGDRKITVPISVKFDKSTEENLKAIKAQLRELNILRKEIEGNAKKGGSGGDLLQTQVKTTVDTNVPEVENQVDSLIKRLDLLADKAREVAKSGGTIGKDFFGKSQGAINKLLENVGGVEELNRRFAGLNDQNAANLTAALKTMFRATLNLDRQKTKLQALKTELGDAFDISTATKQLKDSQENIEGFFYSMDASVPAAFSANVQDELSKASQSTSKFVSTSKTDIRAYNRLINSLEKEEQKAQNLGAGKDKLTEIRSFISDLKSLRQGGASFTLFESTFAVDSLKEIVGSLRLAKILGDQAADSINNIGTKLDKGSLKDTFGGKNTDLAGKSSTLRSGAAEQITRAVAAEDTNEIKKIRTATFAQQTELENRAKTINAIYKKIENQADQFARNPALAALALKLRNEVIPELTRLAGSGDSTETVMQKINKSLNDVIDTKKLEVTVDNAIRKIESLKTSIKTFGGSDVAGLSSFINNLEGSITTKSGGFSTKDATSFQSVFDDSIKQANGLKKLNDEVYNTEVALRAAGDTAKDAKIGQLYKDEAGLYKTAADAIIASANSVEAKLIQLKATRTAAFGNVKTGIQTGASSLIDSIKQLSIEAEAYQSASGGSAAGGGNGFFGFAQQAIDQLKTSIGGAEQINKRFAGLTGDAKNNLLSAVRTVFRAFVDLNSQQDKLERTQKALGPGFKIDDQVAVIDGTKTALMGLLTTYDAVDPSAFAASTSREMKKASDSTGSFVRSAEAGARDYDKALVSLQQQLENARAAGSRDNRLTAFEDLIAKVKELRGLGKSINEIKSEASVQSLVALSQALGFTGINADRGVAALEKLQNKINSGELKNTIGGKIVGLKKFSENSIPSKITDVNNLNASGGNDRNKQINKVVSDVGVQYSALESRATGINSIFSSIFNQIDQFRANPIFSRLADDLQKRLIPSIAKLAYSGESLDKISRIVNQELANAINSKALESKVNTAVNQLQRLKNALSFSGAEDIIGATDKVDKALADLQGRVGAFANLTPDSLNNNISKTLFDVRAAQKFNEQVDATAGKLRLIGQADQSLEVGLLYEQQAAKFETAAKAIAGSSDNVTQKLRKLQQLSKETLINAKFDAEGGFFGSVAKSAGLAAKRLGAFLILAQGLYGVQSLLTTALQDAVKIDREFIKLEQVFNKDFTGAALSKNLSNIKAQITDLGKTLGISTLEIANAGQILAQAGVQGKDLEKLLGTVAKSQLGPSFGSATETAEAAIAIFRQFNLTADQTRDALGGINRVSAKYAVEAQGITEAVRRAGGVFSTSGDQIAGFAASFTLIKQQTREADESIATALRNVAQRLQSSKVQDYLKKTLGIDLVEGGQFVGFEQAITRIGQAIKTLGINEGSPLFSQIREQIAGRLQAGRITPLLQDYDQYQKIVEDFAKGARSIEEDVAVAFNSIENKLQRARSAVTELFTEIIQSPFVKFLVEGFTQMTLVITNLLKIMNSVPGAILAIGTAMKIVSSSNARLIMSLGISEIVSKIKLPNIAKRNRGGGTDGYYPGAGPNKDSFLTALTTGEFVFSRDAVQEYGVPMLDAMNKGALRRNKGGVIPGFNDGGSADNNPFKPLGMDIPKPRSIDFKGIMTKISVMYVKFFHGIFDSMVDTLEPLFMGIEKVFNTRLEKPLNQSSSKLKGGAFVKGIPAFASSPAPPKDTGDLLAAIRAMGATATPQVLAPITTGNSPIEESAQDLYKRMGGGSPKSVDPSIAKVTKSIGPLSGKFKELINTVLYTKKGIAGLAAAAFASQVLFGQFESALSQLVLAMVAGAVSMYSITQLPNSAKSVTDFFGVNIGGKSNTKAKGIAERFNAGRKTNVELRDAKRFVLPDGPKTINGAAASTDDILAAIRKGGAGSGTRAIGAPKSTGAFANSLATGGGKLAKAGKFLTGKLTVGAITIGALSGALSYFTDNAEETAREGTKSAGSLEEAESIGSKGRLLKMAGDAGSIFFDTLSGVITGASVGALSGNPIGVAIGAIVGGITGLFPAIKKPLEFIFSKISSFFSGIANVISDNTPKFIKDGVSYVYGIAKDIAVGAKDVVVGTGIAIKQGASNIADYAYATAYGQDALDNSKSEDKRSFRVAQIGKRFENKKGPIARVNANEIQDLGVSVGFADSLIKQRQAEAKAGGKKGKFEDLPAEDQEKAKAEVQAFADVFKNAGAENQKIMIDAYKKMGIDVEELARTVGVDIGYAEIKAKAAFDELSLFFSNMKKNIEFSGARLTGLDAGLDFYSDPKKQQLIPTNYLDILKEGIDPSTLGLGDTFKNAVGNTEMLIGGFDQRLAKAGDFEISGRRIARSTSDAITANPNLKLDPDNAQAFLTDSFAQGGAGPELLQAFDKFLTADPEKTKGAIDEKTGKIDATKINELFKEFADTLDNGAIEQIKRLIDISNKFVDQYKKAMEDRFAIEGQINDLLLASADKRKTLFDIDNRAKGLTGDKLAQAQGQQAIAIDQEKLGAILSGTGLGGNANVQQMQAALLASQSRGANAAQVADREGLSGAAAVTRKAEIEAIEEERQKRLKAGLTSVAGVTESSTYAMEQFERALQKAANSSKFLTDALLGSDDQIAQTYKGMQAFAKLQQAYAQGGAGAAQATLATFNEDARQALNANIGSDEEKQAKFLEFIGRPTTDISNGPEAQAAKGAVQNQQAAGEALGSALKDDLTRLSKNTEDMKTFYAAQFTNTQQIVQQAEATAKQLVDQIASLPQVITHEGNINVNLIGAGALAQLDEAISTMVQKRIAVEIEKNNKNLKENNAGLNVPVPVQQNHARVAG
jgi:hypothetical protein